MRTSSSIFFLVFTLLLAIELYSQTLTQQVFDKAPKPVFENIILDKNFAGTNPVLPHNAAAVLIGKMWNAYTTQASYTNQIFTDPFSGLIAVIHRIDRTGPGSGRVVYQGSNDGGTNWTYQIGPMNKEPYSFGRHPNCVLSNPTKSIIPGNQALVGGWAELSASWYWYQFASDQSIGAMGPWNQKIDSTYYPGHEMFVNSVGHVFAPMDMIDYKIVGADTVFYQLYRSTNKGNESEVLFTLLTNSAFQLVPVPQM